MSLLREIPSTHPMVLDPGIRFQVSIIVFSPDTTSGNSEPFGAENAVCLRSVPDLWYTIIGRDGNVKGQWIMTPIQVSNFILRESEFYKVITPTRLNPKNESL